MGIFPDSLYDSYILDQHKLPELPYGKSTVNKDGCGFVAVYNVLKKLGKNPDLDDVYTWFHNCVSKGILKGTTLCQLYLGLKHFGLRVRCVRYSNFEKCNVGIIGYTTNANTGHFIAYYRSGDPEKHVFLNSNVYGSTTFDKFKETRIKKLLRIPLFFALEISD